MISIILKNQKENLIDCYYCRLDHDNASLRIYYADSSINFLGTENEIKILIQKIKELNLEV